MHLLGKETVFSELFGSVNTIFSPYSRKSRCIRVKLSGDGTFVGKRIHCVVFSFTLLDEEATVASVRGIHPIAIIREPETYESLQLALSDVIKEVENIQSTGITCGNQTLQVCIPFCILSPYMHSKCLSFMSFALYM